MLYWSTMLQQVVPQRMLLIVILGIFIHPLLLQDSIAGGVVEASSNKSQSFSFKQLEELGGGLVWNNFSACISGSDADPIVHPFCGWVPNGEICAILGPSGSGKTTFLSALAQSSDTSITIHGDILLQQQQQKKKLDNLPLVVTTNEIHSQDVAWLRQDDTFFDALTVKETLSLAVYLELPHLSVREREEIVTDNLKALGIKEELHHRKIGTNGGGSRNTNLSGGELRRLSIAQELISTPNLFLADEPTSGLDSFLGEKVIKLMKSLANDRHIPCICSLHQPRSSTWKLFDRVILMAPSGRACYVGKRTEAIPYFTKLGYVCPKETNPAEFLIDLISIDTDDTKQAIQDEIRIEKLHQAFIRTNKQQFVSTATETTTTTRQQQQEKKRQEKEDSQQKQQLTWNKSPFRYVRRFGCLFNRSLRQNVRSHFINAFRLVAGVGNALLFAQIFPSIPPQEKNAPSPGSVADRVALLSFGVINMSMLAFMKTLDTFSKEKPVVQREQRKNQYTAFEYLLSKSLAELPLDALFASVFTFVLKSVTGLRISYKDITTTFALMTISGASLGFAVSSFAPSREAATSSGVPIIIILLVVGIINPSGVDVINNPPSKLVQCLKYFSPIAAAIEALCIAEFRGMEFFDSSTSNNNNGRGRGRIFRKFRDLPKMGALALVQNGNQVLDALGLKHTKYATIIQHLIKLSTFNLIISWIGLIINNNNNSNNKGRGGKQRYNLLSISGMRRQIRKQKQKMTAFMRNLRNRSSNSRSESDIVLSNNSAEKKGKVLKIPKISLDSYVRYIEK